MRGGEGERRMERHPDVNKLRGRHIPICYWICLCDHNEAAPCGICLVCVLSQCGDAVSVIVMQPYRAGRGGREVDGTVSSCIHTARQTYSFLLLDLFVQSQ